LMFSTFDLRLLLYVIRLAGWLKHCNLSLSLSLCAAFAFITGIATNGCKLLTLLTAPH